MNIAIHELDLPGLPPQLQVEDDTYDDNGDRIMTPQEKADLCRKHYVISNGSAFPVPCGQWRLCKHCFAYRVKKWKQNVNDAIKMVGSLQYKTFSHEDAEVVRSELDHYISFPVGSETVILSPQFDDGTNFTMDEGTQIALLKIWCCTTYGMRPSRSSSCIIKKVPQRRKGLSFYTDADLPSIKKTTFSLDGAITREEEGGIAFKDISDNDLAFGLLLTGCRVWINSISSCTYETIFETQIARWKAGTFGAATFGYSVLSEEFVRANFVIRNQ